ncbi:Panacea domain-containing protein [uncultured Devosia sp.]|uniref:Panacea domain-containing protein n=1 Tax=uncultured Devosia sp. TaxID=211434 RepID=UPI0035CA4747
MLQAFSLFTIPQARYGKINDVTPVRFRFSASKALVALHYMVRECDGIDLHAGLKACYFADKEHLNRYGRPIFGATYKAMKFGPVPLEIYEMAKGEALWLAELQMDRFPWRLEGYRLRLADNGHLDEDELSPSDWVCFHEGLAKSRGLDFNSRTAATHGADWQAANLGIMKYEDMLEDTEDKADRIVELQETAPFVRM